MRDLLLLLLLGCSSSPETPEEACDCGADAYCARWFDHGDGDYDYDCLPLPASCTEPVTCECLLEVADTGGLCSCEQLETGPLYLACDGD